MKRFTLILLLVLSLNLPAGLNTTTPITYSRTEVLPSDYFVKVLTYNIYQSGANEEFLDVLKEENADILLLVETGTWDDNNNNTMKRYTSELNTYFTNEAPYTAYTDQYVNFPTTGVAILSRFPMSDIVEVFELTLDNGDRWYATHDMVVSTIDIFGWDVVVAVSHLKCCSGDFNEERREKEQEGFNNFFYTIAKDTPLIYGGDLNSHYPGEGTSLGTEPVEMVVNATHQNASINHQFVDAFRQLNPTLDGDTFTSGGRIDYIFLNQHVDDYMMNSTTGDTESADLGSDHYSVDVFLNLTHLNAPETWEYTDPDYVYETSTSIQSSSSQPSPSSNSSTKQFMSLLLPSIGIVLILLVIKNQQK